MPHLDRSTARALVDAGYMPLSHYIEMFGAPLMLQEVNSPRTAPADEWDELNRLPTGTSIPRN